MNTPGIEFGRKTAAAYAALCKPLCQKLLENTTEAQRKAFCETMDIMNKNLDAILERDT